MEHFHNYTSLLKEINIKILHFLNKIFGQKFYLFKDKCNFKPSGGEGFYAHYDGIFQWVDKNGKTREGWHDYAGEFINILILLDDFRDNNGPLEIAKIHRGNFAKLLKNTKQNGTPDIKENLVKKIKFEKMKCSAGSIVVFSSNCPHRSSKNRSKFKRGSLYYTYNPKKFGNNYMQYFEDKSSSQNTQSKSLSGEID